MRDESPIALTTPNGAAPNDVLGGANRGVLAILKNSARNCNTSRTHMRMRKIHRVHLQHTPPFQPVERRATYLIGKLTHNVMGNRLVFLACEILEKFKVVIRKKRKSENTYG